MNCRRPSTASVLYVYLILSNHCSLSTYLHIICKQLSSRKWITIDLRLPTAYKRLLPRLIPCTWQTLSLSMEGVAVAAAVRID
jgi:hypothetical protein